VGGGEGDGGGQAVGERTRRGDGRTRGWGVEGVPALVAGSVDGGTAPSDVGGATGGATAVVAGAVDAGPPFGPDVVGAGGTARATGRGVAALATPWPRPKIAASNSPPDVGTNSAARKRRGVLAMTGTTIGESAGWRPARPERAPGLGHLNPHPEGRRWWSDRQGSVP